MSSSRPAFLSGAVLGAAIGLLAGHFTLWAPSQNRAPATLERHHDFPHSELGERSAYLPPEYLGFEPSSAPGLTPLTNAVAATHEAHEAEETIVQIPNDTHAQSEPQPLAIETAAPLSEHKARLEKEVRRLIADELPDLPVAQQEIWFESLRDLESEDVKGVLRMWKLFGGPVPSSLHDPLAKLSPDPLPTLENAASAIPADAQQLWQRALRIHQHNILMSNTPGYRCVIPEFSESESNEATTVGLTTRLDLSPGTVIPSSNPFALAITDTAFFKLRNADGELFLTRHGDFEMSESGSLILASPLGTLTLESVPDLSEYPHQSLALNHAGQITVATDGDPMTIAKLETYRVNDMQQLVPIGNGYYRVPDAIELHAQPARLRAHHLELGNVQMEREMQHIAHLRNLLSKE